MNARRTRWAAAVCGCAVLGGCAANPFKDAEVDPRSPIAAEVAKSVRSDAAYPTFVNFPKAPQGVRPHAQYGADAAKVEKDAAKLVAATADSTWSLTGSETFAGQARTDAGPALAPADPADTAAFAKGLKARATPPPPPKR